MPREGKLASPRPAVPGRAPQGPPGGQNRANRRPPWPSKMFRQYRCGALPSACLCPHHRPLAQMNPGGDPGPAQGTPAVRSLKVGGSPLQASSALPALTSKCSAIAVHTGPDLDPSTQSLPRLPFFIKRKRPVRCGFDFPFGALIGVTLHPFHFILFELASSHSFLGVADQNHLHSPRPTLTTTSLALTSLAIVSVTIHTFVSSPLHAHTRRT